MTEMDSFFTNGRMKKRNRFLSEDTKGRVILGLVVLAFLGWCWFLVDADINPSFMDCPAGHQRISGWSNGSHTNLCISPVR